MTGDGRLCACLSAAIVDAMGFPQSSRVLENLDGLRVRAASFNKWRDAPGYFPTATFQLLRAGSDRVAGAASRRWAGFHGMAWSLQRGSHPALAVNGSGQ